MMFEQSFNTPHCGTASLNKKRCKRAKIHIVSFSLNIDFLHGMLFEVHFPFNYIDDLISTDTDEG